MPGGPPPRWRRPLEVATLAANLWRQVGHGGPRGPVHGAPLLVIPGFIARDASTLALRRAFAAAGFRTYGWDLGWNLGARADTLDRLRARLDSIAPDRPVTLVGWSLGGVFARELARAHPDRVRAVVTLGSPFSGDPRDNNVWRLYEALAGHSVDRPPVARRRAKPPVPHLALWSRRDGIVGCRSARGEDDERDEAIEMRCTHLGFALDGRATRQVAALTGNFLDRFAPEMTCFGYESTPV